MPALQELVEPQVPHHLAQGELKGCVELALRVLLFPIQTHGVQHPVLADEVDAKGYLVQGKNLLSCDVHLADAQVAGCPGDVAAVLPEEVPPRLQKAPKTSVHVQQGDFMGLDLQPGAQGVRDGLLDR